MAGHEMRFIYGLLYGSKSKLTAGIPGAAVPIAVTHQNLKPSEYVSVYIRSQRR